MVDLNALDKETLLRLLKQRRRTLAADMCEQGRRLHDLQLRYPGDS